MKKHLSKISPNIINKLVILVFILAAFPFADANPNQSNVQVSSNIGKAGERTASEESNENHLNSDIPKEKDVQNYSKKQILALEKKVASLEEERSNVSFTEWTGVLLACISVMLTVLGIVIAILSFIGYRSTVKKAEEIATNKTEETVSVITRKMLSEKIEDGSFNDIIEEAVDKVVFKGIFPSGTDEEEEEKE